MNELSLYVLDLAQNSVAAGAGLITIEVIIDSEADTILIFIKDNGKGMSAEFLEKVVSPFTTTRTTRKVGLGIPMIKDLCESCGGRFGIESALGVGTTLSLRFQKSHIDLPPMGDLPGTVVALVNGSPENTDIVLTYKNSGGEFRFDTREIREALGGVSLNNPDVLAWIGGYVSEGIESVGKIS